MAQVNVFAQQDFTGGLNLRSDQFQLADNESPKMLNVEIDPRGGIFSRGGMTRINTSTASFNGAWTPQKLTSFVGDGTSPRIMLATATKLFHSTGGDFSKLQYLVGAVPTDITTNTGHGPCVATWGKRLYIATGTVSSYGAFYWETGDTYATKIVSSGYSPHGWQTTPTGSVVSIPQCEHLCVHAGKMFAAGVTEPTGSYPNRIRWSLAGTATNWDEDDYIDINGGGDGITGMVAVNGSLIIFKPKSVYILYGYDSTDFRVVQISSTLGCGNHHAMAASDSGVYFYSLNRGLFFCDGNGIIDVFQNLRSIIDLGYVSTSSYEDATVSWIGGRVWLSLPYSTSGTLPNYPSVNIVFDPSLGAYTMFQTADGRGVISGCDFIDSTNTQHRLMCHPTEKYILDVDKYGVESDTITSANQTFVTQYRTKWFDGGSYMQKKMFRRPDIVLKEADVEQSVLVSVYHNFDEGDTNWKRQFNITQSPSAVALWDLAQWAETDTDPNPSRWGKETVSSIIKTGKNLGLARTVQLQFDGPLGQSWGVNSIGYKFNSRRVGG